MKFTRKSRAIAACMAAMSLGLQAESGQARCPTIDDVRADGVWVNYEGPLTTVHYAASEPNLLTETQYDPGPMVRTTRFAGGIYPMEVAERPRASDQPALIGTFKYRRVLELPRLKANDTIVVEAGRHLTDKALTGKPARTERVTLTLVTGPIETLAIGDCKYDAIPVSADYKSQGATLFNEGFFLPELGLRIYQSVGMEPFPVLVRYSPVSISGQRQ